VCVCVCECVCDAFGFHTSSKQAVKGQIRLKGLCSGAAHVEAFISLKTQHGKQKQQHMFQARFSLSCSEDQQIQITTAKKHELMDFCF